MKTRTLVTYEPEHESIEAENCPLLRVEGAHAYGRDGTCRECALPRGRAIRNGKE